MSPVFFCVILPLLGAFVLGINIVVDNVNNSVYAVFL